MEAMEKPVVVDVDSSQQKRGICLKGCEETGRQRASEFTRRKTGRAKAEGRQKKGRKEINKQNPPKHISHF